MKQLLVIDADELVYKVGFGSQRTEHYVRVGDITHGPFKTKSLAVEWIGNREADEITSEVIPLSPNRMRKNLQDTVERIKGDVNPDDSRLYLTGENNFRIEVATILPYKGNRTSAGKPVYYHDIKALLIEDYGAITVDDMEADDALSITSWQHQLRESPSWEVTIATQDKDLKMVPGEHYNPTSRELYHMSTDAAKYCFYHQLLTGDTTDNIPGVPGIGKITASKLLDPVRNASSAEMYKIVLQAYQAAENNEKTRIKMLGDKNVTERIEEVARLLWMQQEKGQMWTREEDYYAV